MKGGFPSAEAPMRTVRRALVAQLDEAIEELSSGAASDHGVHAVRVTLKRARAALRLLRACIGTPSYRRQNALIRDAARPLTRIRDSKVLSRTLRGLELDSMSRKSSAAKRSEIDPFLRLLGRELRRRRAEERQRLGRNELRAAAATLRAVRRHIQGISPIRLSRESLGAALERAYVAGRKAYARILLRPTDERLHEWRKQTKYLLNQLDIAAPLGSRRFTKRRKCSRRLARCLGADHDLALLNATIRQRAAAPGAGGGNAAVEELLSRLARRRQALQNEALELGQELYSLEPADMRKKFDAHVRAAPRPSRPIGLTARA